MAMETNSTPQLQLSLEKIRFVRSDGKETTVSLLDILDDNLDGNEPGALLWAIMLRQQAACEQLDRSCQLLDQIAGSMAKLVGMADQSASAAPDMDDILAKAFATLKQYGVRGMPDFMPTPGGGNGSEPVDVTVSNPATHSKTDGGSE